MLPNVFKPSQKYSSKVSNETIRHVKDIGLKLDLPHKLQIENPRQYEDDYQDFKPFSNPPFESKNKSQYKDKNAGHKTN